MMKKIISIVFISLFVCFFLTAGTVWAKKGGQKGKPEHAGKNASEALEAPSGQYPQGREDGEYKEGMGAEAEKEMKKEQERHHERKQEHVGDADRMGKNLGEKKEPYENAQGTSDEMTNKGLEKQKEKKMAQEQKELDKGSEQGQASRENRKKWWKFWE